MSKFYCVKCNKVTCLLSHQSFCQEMPMKVCLGKVYGYEIRSKTGL